MRIKIILFIFIIVVLAVVILIWQQKGAEPTEDVSVEKDATLGESIYEKVIVPENVVKELPQTNPFEAETNPFKGGYKNPFE